MTTLNLLRGGLQQAATDSRGNSDRRGSSSSVASALGALLEDARAGGRATTPGDRWLVLRIEEALRGFDEIRQMATRDHPAEPAYAGIAAEPVSIRAARARASA